MMLKPLQDLSVERFESPAILKALASASRSLAEFKGLAASIPNQNILISALVMQEAIGSSAIENIVTTHDELFKETAFPGLGVNLAAKEVARYAQALRVGYESVRENDLITVGQILTIQEVLEQNTAGFRKLPGTTLKNNQGNVVYTPPQDYESIVDMMNDLERFINEPKLFDADPLIKMALLHHQFESIHPFYDGNGRTGRIIAVLYLVCSGLLDTPILYLSQYIVETKSEYYELLQKVRDYDAWEEWVLYMLFAVDITAVEASTKIIKINTVLLTVKRQVRDGYKLYSQDLINNLFTFPYTKIDYIRRDLKVTRLTATRYLEALTQGGILEKHKIGRSNYYVNLALNEVLTAPSMQ